MSSRKTIGNEVSVDGQTYEHKRRGLDADGVAVVAETPELRASVEQEIQATVDTNHPDATPGGLTLAAEERLEARELEIERTRERWDRRQDSEREARTRQAVGEQCGRPEREPDPREGLSRAELAAVNQQAYRIAGGRDSGASTAAVGRQLAERVAAGTDPLDAALDVLEAERRRPGTPVPIEDVASVGRREVDIQGEVLTLWEPTHHRIQQVGLIGDETGRVKLTIWRRSQVGAMLHEGDRVRVRDAAVNYYRGRPCLAATGRTAVRVLERGDGPAKRYGTRSYADPDYEMSQSRLAVPLSFHGPSEPRPAAGRFEGREEWVFPAEACPEWFREREDVRVE